MIFDMDGVLIDSEPFWEIAEEKVFSALGVNLSPELCALTKRMTTSEVTKFWYSHYKWNNKSLVEVENEVVDHVKLLIEKEGNEIDGIKSLLEFIRRSGYKIALATNAPYELIPIVLSKLKISEYFDFFTSAEFEIEGKPNPAVYLTVARKLKVSPEKCIVFEDSYSGLMAAKNAGMRTIAYRPSKVASKIEEEVEDFAINSFTDLQTIIKILLKATQMGLHSVLYNLNPPLPDEENPC